MLLFFQNFEWQTIIAFLPLIAVIIGAVVATSITYFYGKIQTRKQNTFLLSNEFNTEEMMTARIAASRLLETNELPLSELIKENREDWQKVFRLLHFFDRLDKLKHHNLIDEKLACSLFGNFFENYNKRFEVLLKAQIENPERPYSVVERVSDITWLKRIPEHKSLRLHNQDDSKYRCD